MSHGTGKGANKGANFVGIVHALKKNEHSNQSRTQVPDDQAPSRHLPDTGLKRNTQEWKDAEADKKEKGKERRKNGKGKERSRSGSISSSSSIPSDARSSSGEEEEETLNDRRKGQEGALGRGPGRHERTIPVPKRDKDGDDEGGSGQYLDNGGPMHDSPQDEESSMSFPNGGGKTANGDDKRLHHTRVEGQLNKTGPEGMKDGRPDSGRLQKHRQKGKEGGKGEESDGFDPEERVDEKKRLMTDEKGNTPDPLMGVKKEEPPGPRNQIVLDPRISHMHVSGGPLLSTSGPYLPLYHYFPFFGMEAIIRIVSEGRSVRIQNNSTLTARALHSLCSNSHSEPFGEVEGSHIFWLWCTVSLQLHMVRSLTL